MNQLPNFAPALMRSRMGDLFQDDGLWTPDASTPDVTTDSSDSGGFVGPVMPAGDSSTPSWLTTAVSTATNAAINAAKGALGIRTTPVKRTTSTLPSWLLPVGLGVVALVLLSKKK